MKIGLIGLGTVGGTLNEWLKGYTNHDLAYYDPPKNLNDSLKKCDAIFISVPYGEEHEDKILLESVEKAKLNSKNVFIKSTVLPGTNDSLGTISNPEYLTARRAFNDFEKHPIIVGKCDLDLVNNIFPTKKIIQGSNLECEVGKYMHNCFGATKVIYFNMFKKLCDFYQIKYDSVKEIANASTGYLGDQHTSVPGHDGKLGFGGVCFGPNMQLLEKHFNVITKNKALKSDFSMEKDFINLVRNLNIKYRGSEK